jgi:hypothetical protein
VDGETGSDALLDHFPRLTATVLVEYWCKRATNLRERSGYAAADAGDLEFHDETFRRLLRLLVAKQPAVPFPTLDVLGEVISAVA